MFQSRTLGIGCVCAFAAAAHADPQWQIASGAQYSSGAYGDVTDTKALVIPIYLRATGDTWSVQASVPFVSVDGPESVADLIDDNGGLGSNSGSGGASSGSEGRGPGNGGNGNGNSGGDGEGDGSAPTPPPDPGVVSRRASGLGDTSLTVTYSAPRVADSGVYFQVRGRVRLPTGSRADGLGVGATDYALLSEAGLDYSKGGVYVSGGRRFLGTVNGLDRVDGWQAGAGAWLNVAPHVIVGLNADWRDASVRGGIAPKFAEAFVAWRINDTWKLEVNAGSGLSDSSADFAAGFTLSWRSRPGSAN